MDDERCWCSWWPGPHAHQPEADFQPCPPVRVTREQWRRHVGLTDVATALGRHALGRAQDDADPGKLES